MSAGDAMRAWQVVRHGAPSEALELVSAPRPEPGPGMLRVRVSAAAIGLPDLFMCRGNYLLTPKLPFTPGQELAGVVTAAGPGCRTRVGERVMAVSGFFLGHGAFADEALALDDFCFPVADVLSDAEAAAMLIAFHTAYIALVRRGALARGETLLVLGAAGGTGSAAVQIGRALGARVLATASGSEKRAFCRELGADVVIDRRSEDIAARVREETGGRGADVVFDTAGGAAFDAATRAIAHEGRLLLIGFASGRWGSPQPAHMVSNNYSVVGVIPSGYDRDFKQAANDWLLERLRTRALRVPVARVLPFASLPEGIAALEAGDVMGRLVVAADDQGPAHLPGLRAR